MDTISYFNQRFGDSPSTGCACGSTKPAAHPVDGDGVSDRNVRKSSHLDAAVWWRKFHRILSPRKVQDLQAVIFCFVLFCFVLFCFVLFCFVLFCFPESAGKFLLSFDCQVFGSDIPAGLS